MELKIEYIAVEELKPYENNPRVNEDAVKFVENSIKQFGFNSPIIIDKNKVIICGHTRYMASQGVGLDKVPCIFVDDLTDEQIKAFRLIDNKCLESSRWDIQKLKEEIQKILSIDMSDFSVPSFDVFDGGYDDFFEEAEQRAKTVVCPFCGGENEI